MTLPRTLDELAPLMDLRPTERGFTVATLATEHGAIMGAYQLLQQVLAAERADPDKRVLSLHTAFVHGGRSGEPVDIAVEFGQRGRSFSSATLTTTQDGRLVSRAVVLLTADEPDFLRHQAPAPRPASAQDWTEVAGLWPGASWRSRAGTPGESVVRLGVEGVVPDGTVGRALTAMATEGAVMSALIEMSEGWEFRQGSANVLTQSVTLLEPIGSTGGVVVTGAANYAGRGRAHGTGTVTDDDGRLLATFQTTGVLRGPAPPAV
ncbi:acyl-CoA thioesterase domain-containing protein [Blastococcus sp. URHD0036]|uniref:acyl-CoA thioesterase domain-containing protein n=1 Tax=Blastococcus sp. URHD0036 TaxID=1380356 RepID=UPI000495A024|nr:acyl-CoA thioesterase domain-containing protein [Blastococcus sp. URHD0036]